MLYLWEFDFAGSFAKKFLPNMNEEELALYDR
jgi:hypothetical protein